MVGFEDSPSAAHTDPPLTTVHQPVEAMGREMVRLLLARIGGSAPERAAGGAAHPPGGARLRLALPVARPDPGQRGDPVRDQRAGELVAVALLGAHLDRLFR